MIDEFNMLYKGWDKLELKIEADEKFNEMDITVRLGYPFKQNAHYTAGESGRIKKAQKINHDIYKEKGFYNRSQIFKKLD